MTYDGGRSVLELASYAANGGLLIVAGFALEQIRVAKQDLKTRVRREAAKEASQQLDLWATTIIPTVDELTKLEDLLKITRHGVSMERFDREELLAASRADKAHHDAIDERHASPGIALEDTPRLQPDGSVRDVFRDGYR
jgi:hypothetical protein